MRLFKSPEDLRDMLQVLGLALFIGFWLALSFSPYFVIPEGQHQEETTQ